MRTEKLFFRIWNKNTERGKEIKSKMKKKCVGIVRSAQELAVDVYDSWIETEIAKDAAPGQFVGVFTAKDSTLLPRPISICEVDDAKEAIRIVYRVVGKGTSEFSHYKAGRRIWLLGVLGNGYPIEEANGKHALLLGGGIGIPPLVELAKQLRNRDHEAKITVSVGYRSDDLFLTEELARYADVLIATEDGSVGTKGNVMDAVKENKITPDIIYSCGPMPMLKAIKTYAQEKDIPAYISLEERMACGVGACLGCVCKTTQKDHHSHVNNARICTDGPVFEAKEVEI